MTPEVDPAAYEVSATGKHKAVESLGELSGELQAKLKRIGIMIAEEEGAATFLQQDQDVSFCNPRSKDVEVMGISQAMAKHGDWLQAYSWKAVKADTDAFTRDAAIQPLTQGYFIRALPGKKIAAPVQTCLYIEENNSKQVVHNIIIAEEDSELNIITGCAAHSGLERALHEGISEFYVKKGAKITFTMIHEWQEGIEVRPRSAIIVEDGGTFINNYIALKPVKSIQSNPIAYLGEGARVMFQAIIYAKGDSSFDLGSRAILTGNNASADMITRVITKDNANVVARGLIVGEGKDVKGHLECRGLLLSSTSRIHSIPELDARNPDVTMTHEAAVGKISRDEINYLMARGATEDEATSMIINGFLSFDFSELPGEIAAETRKLIDQTMDAS